MFIFSLELISHGEQMRFAAITSDCFIIVVKNARTDEREGIKWK